MIWIDAHISPAISISDRLKEILSSKLLEALDLLNSGEPLVEISGN
jgi:hypothetical protein